MKKIVHTSYTYEAIDGRIFATEQECRNWENFLPKDLVFCLEKGYSAEALKESATYELGYTSEWTTEEYEAPGFLREGGEYTAHHNSDHRVQLVEGTLAEVVSYAFTIPAWTKMGRSKFIRKVKITKI